MQALATIRRRDGAMAWSIFVDAANPSRYLETFVVESWGEHMRQHYRLTVSDSETELYARSFHVGTEPPAVIHMLAPLMR